LPKDQGLARLKRYPWPLSPIPIKSHIIDNDYLTIRNILKDSLTHCERSRLGKYPNFDFHRPNLTAYGYPLYLQTMKTTVQRWGNSLALRIPKAFAEETHVKEGTAVILSLSDGSMVMRLARRPKASLRALLFEIDASNLSSAGFEDRSLGKEIG
jgi:antitoxin MazE